MEEYIIDEAIESGRFGNLYTAHKKEEIIEKSTNSAPKYDNKSMY